MEIALIGLLLAAVIAMTVQTIHLAHQVERLRQKIWSERGSRFANEAALKAYVDEQIAALTPVVVKAAETAKVQAKPVSGRRWPQMREQLERQSADPEAVTR